MLVKSKTVLPWMAGSTRVTTPPFTPKNVANVKRRTDAQTDLRRTQQTEFAIKLFQVSILSMFYEQLLRM